MIIESPARAFYFIQKGDFSMIKTAIPQVEKTLIRLSRNFPRFKAAIQPSGMPKHNATSTEMPPTLAEIGNFI